MQESLRSRTASLSLLLVLVAAPSLAQSGSATRPADAATLERLGLARATLQTLALPDRAGAPIATAVFVEGAPHTLLLDPISLRARDYRLLVQGPDGLLREATPSPPATYRGHFPDYPGSVATGSLRNGVLTGGFRLRPGEAAYGIEPLDPAASLGAAAFPSRPAEHVVYDSRDLLPTSATCGLETFALPRLPADAPAPSGAPGGGGTPTVRICQIACDADTQFYQSKGSSVANVEADIENIVGGVESIYQSDAEIVYEITTIVVRTTEPDPYTTSDPSGLLDEFRIEWNSNQGGIQRDVAHLFTGKNLSGSTIGIASLGVICNLGNAYGLSQSNFTGSFTFRVGLTAHELGHNWSASHCDGQGDCKIMCSAIGACGPVTSFGSSAISSILSEKASSGCLGFPPPTVAPTLLNLTPASVQALSGPQVTLTGDDFLTTFQVDVGGVLLGAGDFNVVNDTKLTFTPPQPLALGANDVTITNVVGESNVATLTYTAVDPPLMITPVTSPTGGPFTWTYAAPPFDIGFLLVALNPATFNIFGLDLLLNAVHLNTELLGAVGVGGITFVLPPTLPAGTVLYSQLLTYDLVDFDASGVSISVLSF